MPPPVPVLPIRPLGNRVLVRDLAPRALADQTLSGLYIPTQSVHAHQRHMQAEVVACGPDCDQMILPGLRVIVQRWSKVPVDDSGELWVTWDDAVVALLIVD